MTTLYVRDQSGYREAQATDVLDRAHALLAQRYRAGSPVLTSPALTREFLRVHLGAREQEIFGVLHLDSRHRLIAVENLFRGTINSASVRRTVFSWSQVIVAALGGDRPTLGTLSTYTVEDALAEYWQYRAAKSRRFRSRDR